MKLNIIFGIIICIIIFLLYRCTVGTSNSSTLKEWISAGALIVDVRTPEEFSAGNYKNSINVPVSDIEKKPDIFGDRNRSIIVYCRSGGRSGKAKKILEAHGYSKVLDAGAFSSMPD